MKSFFIILGVCEDGNFTDEGFGSDMRLQDIKRVVLDPDNMLYVLCGSQGNGTVRITGCNSLVVRPDKKIF